MFLATTSLKEFWDAGDELLLLGPWCVRFEDPRWLEGLNVRNLPNVWDDRALLERSARYVVSIQPDLLARLGAYLNRVHGTRLGARYWEIQLGPWLLAYSQQLLDRHAQLAAALRAYPDAKTLALDPRDFIVPRDTGEFRWLFHTDHYNLQLYSQILRFLGRRPEERRHAPPALTSMNPEPPSSPMSRLRRAAKGWVRRAVAKGGAWAIPRARLDLATDEIYGSGRLLWRILRGFRGRALPLLNEFPDSLRVPAAMDERRAGLASLEAEDEFRRLLISTLPAALPTIFLEGFARARAWGPAASGRVPRAVLAGPRLYYNECFKFAAAEWVERGAELWMLQHGGQYGTSKFVIGEWLERRISDRFYTWGWASTEEDSKLRDLPVPSLSERAAKAARASRLRRPRPTDILLVTSELMKNSHHLLPTPMGWQWEEYFDWRDRFIAALGGIIEALSVRLSPQDYGWRQRERLARRFPGLRFDSHAVGFLDRIARARLVVLDHPSTTFLETMALGVPSISFWSPARWEVRPAAAPYFEALRGAGILHSDPESAARLVLKEYADPEPWWRTETAQAARRDFVERYARVRDDWPNEWKRELLDGDWPRGAPTRGGCMTQVSEIFPGNEK